MAIKDVLAHIDEEISKLQQVRAMLAGTEDAVPTTAKPTRGRPKGSKNAAPVAPVAPVAKKATGTGKRKLSPEGRKAIAEAMKRRWAAKRAAK